MKERDLMYGGIGSIILAFIVFTGLYIHENMHATEHYEMTQAETIRLIRALDTALAVRQQAEAATQTYNTTMAEVRKAHNWPDDLIFDGTEWKHPTKLAGPEVKITPKTPEPAKPEPAKK